MDDSDGIVLFVVGCLVCAGLFFGVIYGIKKIFNAPPQPQIIDSSDIRQQQRQRADEAEYQRKRTMDQLKQKNRDYRRKL